jgi:streptogramin lyase
MGNATLRRVTPMGLVSTFAGTPPLIGSVDAIGASARFSRPEGVAADASGNVYVADRGNVTLRKIASDGTVSTLAGLAGSGGLVNGQGSTARFNGITGVASTAAGTVYVADYYNHAIRSVASNGTVATFAGGSLGSLDGQGTAAQFNYPSGVAVDTSGSVYVADSYNQVIRRISPAGAVTTLAGSPGQSGSTDGQGNAARFSFPIAVAPDSAGNVYVCDRENSTIRKVAPDGTVSTLAGSAGQVGNVDGTGAAARFNKPLALSLDPISGNLYIADSGNSLVRMVTPSGVVTTVAGQPGVNGGLLGTLPGVISQPLGITVAPDGRIHFSTQNGVVTMVR